MKMRRRGRKFVLVGLVVAALVPIAAIVPAGAAAVPSAPALPGAIPGNATARVIWVAPANNGSAITSYVVTPFIGAVAQPAHTFNSTAVSQVVTGLTNTTVYTFRVKAHNAVGTGANSVASFAIRVGTPVPPAAAKVAPGAGQVRVNWVAPASNGSPVTGYVVVPLIGTVAQPARTFTTAALAQNIAGLTNGTAYKFRVSAVNARGVGPRSFPSAAVTPTAQATLKLVMNATIGQPILVNSAGMTVYMFTPDGAGTTSMVTGGLRAAWPYVTWSGAITVGAGLTLSSATGNVQPDNTRLIAYHGHLLYTFTTDQVPGDVTGQAVNSFFVLDGSGNKIP